MSTQRQSTNINQNQYTILIPEETLGQNINQNQYTILIPEETIGRYLLGEVLGKDLKHARIVIEG